MSDNNIVNQNAEQQESPESQETTASTNAPVEAQAQEATQAPVEAQAQEATQAPAAAPAPVQELLIVQKKKQNTTRFMKVLSKRYLMGNW